MKPSELFAQENTVKGQGLSCGQSLRRMDLPIDELQALHALEVLRVNSTPSTTLLS